MNAEQVDRAARLIEIPLPKTGGARSGGVHRGVRPGEGLELYGVRLYAEGDDPRHIDSAATARTGELHTRSHVQEAQMNSAIVLDTSASMGFGSGVSKWDAACLVARIVSRSLTMRGDMLAVFRSTGVGSPLRSGRSARRVLDEMLTVTPKGSGNIAEQIDAVSARAYDGAAVIISDFLDCGANELQVIHASAARRPVTVIRITDPRELDLPATNATVTLSDPESGAQSTVRLTGALREAYNIEIRERRNRVAEALKGIGCTFVEIDAQKNIAEQLTNQLPASKGRR